MSTDNTGAQSANTAISITNRS